MNYFIMVLALIVECVAIYVFIKEGLSSTALICISLAMALLIGMQIILRRRKQSKT